MLDFANSVVWAGKLFGVALPWYLNLQLISLAAFPLCFRVCTRLHDRGYAFAKAFGLVLVTYISWLLCQNAMFFRYIGWLLCHNVVVFSYQSVAAATAIVGTISVVSVLIAGRSMFHFLRTKWKLLIAYEAVFLLAFVLMLVLRSHVPSITYVINDYAAEKFTDFSILNGLLTSQTFPPHDAWVSGSTLNYYYFGHLMWATLIKLGGYRPEIGFNLALATIFALVVLQSVSLGYNISRKAKWAALCGFLIALSSNIDGFLQLVGIIQNRLTNVDSDFRIVPWYLAYDFWRSSRAIAGTINEFPAFSFVLGDLHAHLSSLVIFLAGLLLAIQMWRSARAEKSLMHFEWNCLDQLAFASILAGALYASNAWDAITYGGILAAIMWSGASGQRSESHLAGVELKSLLAAVALVLAAVVVLIGRNVFFYSFVEHFDPPFTGWPLKWVSDSNRSSTLEYVAHWILLGWAPFTVLMTLASRGARRAIRSGRMSRDQFQCVVAVMIAVAFLLFTVLGGWVASFTICGSIVLAVILLTFRMPPALRLVASLAMVFLVLSCFCELLYFDDIFVGDIERINTVFKIYYGLWPTMALATILSLPTLVRWARPQARTRRTVLIIAGFLLIGGVYPVLAPLQRVAALTMPPLSTKNPTEALDGMLYLKQTHPGDYAAIMWIRNNAPPDIRILESPGHQYEYNGRISTNSGRPALAGWLYHSWAWRGDTWVSERDRRQALAQTIYCSADANVALSKLQERGVQLVVIGDQERDAYPELCEDLFDLIGIKVFESQGTSIYLIPSASSP